MKSLIWCVLLLVASSVSGGEVRFAKHGDCITVRGQSGDVIAFLYRYQDSLFPSWRTSQAAVEQIDAGERSAREYGKVHLFVGGDEWRKAFVSAIR